MKITVLVLMIVLLVLGCSSSNVLEKYDCKIIETDTSGTAKKSIDIRIQKQITEVQLTEVADYLRSQNKQYERLFIVYILPDMVLDSGAWATTHFNPDLEVNILGATEEEEATILDAELPPGEIIGKWYDSSMSVEHSVIIYLIDEQYMIRETYSDGIIEKELDKVEDNGTVKYIYENSFGEFYQIEADRSLGLYDDLGLISNSKIID